VEKKHCRFSIIVPVLNEAATINTLVRHLTELKPDLPREVIVVDGDPDQGTIRAIQAREVITLVSPAGRARQMNAGAQVAQGDILIFLHADTQLPHDALSGISVALSAGQYVGGAFDLGIQSDRVIFKLIAAAASLRSRITRIPYGDQAIFLRKDYFTKIGGYHDMPLMEDIELMRRIKRSGKKIFILRDRVMTSPRRWQKEAIWYCTARNWILSSLYYLGVSPHWLTAFYPVGGEHGQREE
jgi:rSAM/selenodomain-associated transferase 2